MTRSPSTGGRAPKTQPPAQAIAEARTLPGPILVVGASGFVGANLLRTVLEARGDVCGTYLSRPSWRLEGVPPRHLARLDAGDLPSVKELLDRVRPRTIFYLAAYGGYSFQTEADRIYRTNLLVLQRFLAELERREVHAFIHAGSSSEYGLNAARPVEDAPRRPNSHYAVSKSAAADLLHYYGHLRGLPCVNLRLFSVYGPWEDSSRLVPTLVEHGLRGLFPALVSPTVTHDFIHVDDVARAFILAAAGMRPEIHGSSYNIGTGRGVSMEMVAAAAQKVLGIDQEPPFGEMANRPWDLDVWCADPRRAEEELGWRPTVTFEVGLRRVADWWSDLLTDHRPAELTCRVRPVTDRQRLTAVVACYKDSPAIPVMYERLRAVCERVGLDYQIIFVNDGSPDDSEEVIRDLSARDEGVLGITHSRNFGSQAAFRSGLDLATGEASVLLDGDLQDPPELIEDLVARWREGWDVVYGRRVRRQMPRWRDLLYRTFYRLFRALSSVPMPTDAGDFSLLDRRVVAWLLRCPERDSFLRGLRAYVGFRQVGVDYERPERAFGHSTNTLVKNLWWARKAIFSFSAAPLSFLFFAGCGLLGLSLTAGVGVLVLELAAPVLVPRGAGIALLVALFGSLNLVGAAILGQYVGKIVEEVKGRPAFIRRHLIHDGQILPAEPEPR